MLPPSRTSAVARRWRTAVALFAVFAVALALRAAWFTDVVTTSSLHEPDTADKIDLARDLAFGNEYPGYFKHPLLLVNTSAWLLRAGTVFGFYDKASSTALMTGYMIFLSSVTVLIVFGIGLAVFGSEGAALLGALVYAVVPLGVIGPHYVKEDIPLMTTCGLAVLSMVWLLRRRDPRLLLLSGLAVGLAIGTKLAALSLLVVFVSAYVLLVLSNADGPRRYFGRELALGLLLIPIGFALTSP